jgi:hypothetical protein
VLIIIFIPVALYLSFGIKNAAPQNQVQIQTPTPVVVFSPTPIPSDFNLDYSNINKLTPGKSTFQDVKAINGLPASTSFSNNNTTFYYQTPSGDYKNIVFFESGIVKYAIEHVFGNYRGDYETYIQKYGQPTLQLYNKTGTDFAWFIFLKQGVGLEVGGNNIMQILYFAPQSKEDFMQNIAAKLNLTNVSPERQGDPVGNANLVL